MDQQVRRSIWPECGKRIFECQTVSSSRFQFAIAMMLLHLIVYSLIAPSGSTNSDLFWSSWSHLPSIFDTFRHRLSIDCSTAERRRRLPMTPTIENGVKLKGTGGNGVPIALQEWELRSHCSQGPAFPLHINQKAIESTPCNWPFWKQSALWPDNTLNDSVNEHCNILWRWLTP